MTDQEAHKLATRIPKEAWHPVRTKLGRTNGKPTIHIIDKQTKQSTTIYTEGEWLVHDLNKRNKPSKKRVEEVDLVETTKNFTRLTARMQAAFGRLTEAAVGAAAAGKELSQP